MYQKEARKSNLFRNRSHIFEHGMMRKRNGVQSLTFDGIVKELQEAGCRLGETGTNKRRDAETRRQGDKECQMRNGIRKEDAARG
jgi:hypothetical protein